MAECMFNSYDISFDDEDEAKKFYDKLMECYNAKSPESVNWSRPWLGNVVIGFGVDEWDDRTREFENKTFAAGCFSEEPDFDGITVTIKTETKYDPDKFLWETVVGMYSKTAEVIYSAMHESDSLLLTNDVDLTGRYIVDVQDEDVLKDLVGERRFNKIKELLGNDTYCSDMSLEQVKRVADVLKPGCSLMGTDFKSIIEDESEYSIKVNAWEEEEFVLKEVSSFAD